MRIDQLIKELNDRGVSMFADGEVLELKPQSRIPTELKEAIQLHKIEIINKIVPRHPLDSELTEIIRQVRAKGYVCLWSTVLEDNIAFVDDILEEDQRPEGFVIYTLDEITKLFANTKSENSLRLVHIAKKRGAKITDVYPS